MQEKKTETFFAASQAKWRKWLQKNHDSKQSVWLVYHKKKSGLPSITYPEAVDEALCFGWIDSTARPMDDEKYMQYFCKRKPTSSWSLINKEKVRQLMDKGLMTTAGLECIEKAKQNGSWTIMDSVEALKTPPDLNKAFKTNRALKNYFQQFSKSDKKIFLQSLVLAKRPETRQKRIDKLAMLAAANQQLK